MTILLNENLLVQRQPNGIKLIQPKTFEHSLGMNSRTYVSLYDLFNSQFHVYVEDKHNTIVDMSESCANLYGYESKQMIVGRSLTELSSLDKRRFNNRLVMRSDIYAVFHEIIRLRDNKNIDLISLKFPWLNDANKVQGVIVFDFDIHLNQPSSFTDQIDKIIDLIDSTKDTSIITNIRTDTLENLYTKREIEVIKWVVRGKTSREIANITGLGKRTIESYFENIKKKADVKSKSQFIDKAINNYNL